MSQLHMEKDDLENVPAIPVPEGYLLRTFRDGDEADLGRIYQASDLGSETAEAVRERMFGDACFTPERLIVVEHEGGLVATAAAWIKPHDPGVGYLHMVGVLPGHRGKKLGALVTVAAIRYTHQEGFAVQRLETDDWRVPAVKLYLDLGYYPLSLDDTHPGRWQALAEQLNRPEIMDQARMVEGS